jgi:hypothetical protein
VDARSLALPRYGLGVGLSVRTGAYVNYREVPLVVVPRSSDLFFLKYEQSIFRIHLVLLGEVFNDIYFFRDQIV